MKTRSEQVLEVITAGEWHQHRLDKRRQGLCQIGELLGQRIDQLRVKSSRVGTAVVQ